MLIPELLQRQFLILTIHWLISVVFLNYREREREVEKIKVVVEDIIGQDQLSFFRVSALDFYALVKTSFLDGLLLSRPVVSGNRVKSDY